MWLKIEAKDSTFSIKIKKTAFFFKKNKLSKPQNLIFYV